MDHIRKTYLKSDGRLKKLKDEFTPSSWNLFSWKYSYDYSTRKEPKFLMEADIIANIDTNKSFESKFINKIGKLESKERQTKIESKLLEHLNQDLGFQLQQIDLIFNILEQHYEDKNVEY